MIDYRPLMALLLSGIADGRSQCGSTYRQAEYCSDGYIFFCFFEGAFIEKGICRAGSHCGGNHVAVDIR